MGNEFAYGLTEEELRQHLSDVITVECVVDPETYQPMFHVKSHFTMEVVQDVGTRFAPILGDEIMKKAIKAFIDRPTAKKSD